MRPAGAIREMVLDSVREVMLEHELPGAHFRHVCERLVPAGVAEEAVRYTMDNLARCDALVAIDRVRVPGVCRPLVLYAPADDPPEPPSAQGELWACVRTWAQFA